MNAIRSLIRFWSDERGVGSIYMLCLLPLFLVLAGLGMDGSAAFRTREMLRSTADAAAIAGALKLPTAGGATATQEANAAAAARTYAQANMSVAGFGNVLNLNATTNGDIQFGYWDGSAFTTPPPTGTSENAIQVTVKTAAANSNAYPTSFLALIGKSNWDISATAVAMIGKSTPLCILILGTMTKGSGSPGADLTGCSIGSNGDLLCNGHNLKADYGLAVGTNGGSAGCGNVQFSGVTPIVDPYASLNSSIPANSCASYPGTSWSGAQSLGSGATQICGTLTLTNDVTINTPAGGSQIVIQNGQLNTAGHKFKTANGSYLTLIFSGDNSGANLHNITSSGTLDFSGPTSGTWKGISVYQNTSLTDSTGGLDEAFGGNSPTWNISGVVYLPHSNTSFSGAVNKSNNGASCIIFVVNDIAINGTADIVAQGGCQQSGTTQPNGLAPLSVLVQ